MDAGISPGDIVLLQINDTGAATGCLVKWAPLVNIPSGTAITFTDRSWVNGPAFFGVLSSEGEATFTAPSTITAGTIFTFRLNAPSAISLTRDSDGANFNSSIAVTGWTGSFTLTSAGDNFFAFTGTDTSPTFIFGTLFTTVTLNRNPVTGWSTNTTGTTTSLLPPGLTNGVNAMSLDYSPSAPHYMAYTGSTTTTNKAAWLARIVNTANWTTSGSTVSGSFGTSVSLLSSSPTVVKVTSSTANGSYKTGSTINIQIDFSTAVTVTGTPTLALNTGRTASYTSGSGTTNLVFAYSVQAGDTASHLDYSATNSLSANGGTITDSSDDNASLTLPAPGASGSLSSNTALVIDTTAPTVTISSPSTSLTNSGPISYTVTWSDAGLNSSSISLSGSQVILNKTGTASCNSVSVTGSGNTRTVQLNQLTGNGTISISIPANTASDLAGNSAPAAGPSAKTVVDNTPPTISVSAPSPASTNTGGSVRCTVTYFDTNFAAATLSAANITLTNTAITGSINVITNNSTNFTVVISGLRGIGAQALVIAAGTATDLAGNSALATSPSSSFTVVPTVSAVSPTNGSTSGGTTVTITGSGFAAGATVQFGTSAGSGVTVVSANTITTTSPPGTGTLNVTVTVGGETSATTVADLFTYTGPVAVNDSVIRATNGPTKIAVAQLLANDSDLQNLPLSLIAVTNAQGGTVSLVAPWIVFTPSPGLGLGAASFEYVVADGSGVNATATVSLTTVVATNSTASTILGITDNPDGPGKVVTFAAIPGLTYQVFVSTDMIAWTSLGSFNADNLGRIVVTDTGATGGSRFYSLRN